ncbi:MAG: addiction module protein [Xanthomonadales bacterium]|nr:addiction module protein [Xanthomonadales bacterium]
MSTTTKLAELPLTERLMQMEALWDSLCREPEQELSPPWHAAVLAEREPELARGEHEDWNTVKSRLHTATLRSSKTS